ncbi:MAG: prepilin peptidase [Cyanobium sp. MAG06]|nr:prepilin peptidase [Cyanobium sp. MAG06]
MAVTISIYDIKHKLIIEPALYILFCFSFIVLIYRQMTDNISGIYYIDLFSGLIIAVPFIIVFLITRGKGLGMGDILLYIALGCLLPLQYSIYIFLYSV